MFQKVAHKDAEIAKFLQMEVDRQRYGIELIASENFVSPAVLEAQGSHLTNKYAEGYPGKRYYGGCEYVDEVEKLAISRACELFGSEHANVQPHSGSNANLAVYKALMSPGDTLMGLSLAHGGHLTHGHKVNFSGQLYQIEAYEVDPDTERIDYDKIREQALKVKPKILLAGYSAYTGVLDFKKFREIADEVGAYLMVDMAHFAGLVAAKVYPDPVPYADVVTTTTHKTLRGPRAGLILCKEELAKKIDKAIFPGMQGGPLMHVIAAKAVSFKEALCEEFVTYQKAVIENAQTLADELASLGLRLVGGGTSNHIVLVDVTPLGLTGTQAENALERACITCNKNAIPFDPNPPSVASGIRLGTPAITTRGMRVEEMKQIATWIGEILKNPEDSDLALKIRSQVRALCDRFPLYSQENQKVSP